MRRKILLLVAALIALAVLAGWALSAFWTSEPQVVPTLAGEVVDDSGPVSGARVRFQESRDFVLTDEAGVFSLPLPEQRRTITAWKSGYTIGAAASDAFSIRISIKKLLDEDNADYRWVPPHVMPDELGFCGFAFYDRCDTCHKEVHDEWHASAHGRPNVGSRFRDLFFGLDSAGHTKGWGLMQQRPDGEKVCSSCHDPAPLDSALSSRGPQWGGVHCDFCHKIIGAGGGEVGLTHGKYGLEFLRPKNGQVFFGPLEDAARERENSYSSFQRKSRLCASCHEGVIFGVRVYETYSEWQSSPAGTAGVQCQECHMKPTGTMINMAPRHGGIDRDPMTLANHTFFDGSHQDMLKNCARLTLDVTPPDKAVVNLSVEGVGHRVPTGLPDRNLTLVVEAFDSTGKSLATREKVFAKVLKDFQGKSPAPFWRAVPEFEDNRLTLGKPERVEFDLPAGAAKVTAKLVYRKFWPQVAREKGWPDDAWVVAERAWTAP